MEVELCALSAIHAVDEALGSLSVPMSAASRPMPSLSRQQSARGRSETMNRETQTDVTLVLSKGIQAVAEKRSQACQSSECACRNRETQTMTVEKTVVSSTKDHATQTVGQHSGLCPPPVSCKDEEQLKDANARFQVLLEAESTRRHQCEHALLQNEQHKNRLVHQIVESEARHSIIVEEANSRFQLSCFITVRLMETVRKTEALLLSNSLRRTAPSSEATVKDVEGPVAELFSLLQECREALGSGSRFFVEGSGV